MKISIFGIGYVGAVASACLAKSGHEVVAVDPFQVKVDCINEGRSPIVENQLDELIKAGVDAGRLRATTDYKDAIMNSEMSLICVGTPSEQDGSLDYKYIKEICAQIGSILKDKDDFHIVVNRSTVIPGTIKNVIQPILEETSGKKAGVDFGLGNNPEFLRESTAVKDYFEPTQIVVGALSEKTAEKIMSLYEGIESTRTITDVSIAEGVKYVSNAWRANKISFANEMGNILKHHGVDSHEVMKIFFEDTKINMGPYFLMPGFAFGGSCLPKDVKAIRSSANGKGLQTPVFDSILAANNLQIDHAYQMIEEAGVKRVGLMGLAFKPNTDDLRESPLVKLADKLLDEGYELAIYDPCVYKARKMNGANRDYIVNGIPHISKCLVESPEELLAASDIVVIGNGTKEFSSILQNANDNLPIVDLVRLNSPIEKRAAYSGICW
ncbi:MAG: nucleotide sugar dehydrogenase [Alphaproteobacteria bacterium]